MTLSPSGFVYEHDTDTGVATITLNRPDRLNALTFEIYRELTDAFVELSTEPGVRVVMLTGSGRAFCSGGDVEDIIGALLGRSREELLKFTRLTCDLIQAMRECSHPIVAALNGTVAGAGAVMAAAADIRIAADTAKIAFLFTRVGLSGADMGAAWLLPRIVGFGNASRILMTGDFVDANEACRIGLYHEVVGVDDVVPRALEVAEQLAKGPAAALSVTKNALNCEASMSLRDAMQFEAEIQAECMEHDNFKEAHRAFVEKRKPRFE